MQRGYHFVVTGRVQHVRFRVATAAMARSLALSGWVRNRPDGGVEGLVYGEDSARMQRFRDYLASGPDAARVVAVVWEAVDEAGPPGATFSIRR
ncbi:MAG: acylphosphatase [Nevskiaceae bacterium]|nr:MAG: acylphosphatase [Nevskiaceae bacterium]TBR72728.1 MAG: acylphosphatase [Nevskiaceae bacterium]